MKNYVRKATMKKETKNNTQ